MTELRRNAERLMDRSRASASCTLRNRSGEAVSPPEGFLKSTLVQLGSMIRLIRYSSDRLTQGNTLPFGSHMHLVAE